MDKQIRKIEKETKKVSKDLKHLEKEDIVHDRKIKRAEKIMKKKNKGK